MPHEGHSGPNHVVIPSLFSDDIAESRCEYGFGPEGGGTSSSSSAGGCGRRASRCRAQGQADPAGGIARGRGRHRAALVGGSVWVGSSSPRRGRSRPVGTCGDPCGRRGVPIRGVVAWGRRVWPRHLGWAAGCSLKPREAHTWRPPRRRCPDGAGSRAGFQVANPDYIACLAVNAQLWHRFWCLGGTHLGNPG